MSVVAVWLCDRDGSMFEELDTLINEALNPVIYKDEDGIKHYFDTVSMNDV